MKEKILKEREVLMALHRSIYVLIVDKKDIGKKNIIISFGRSTILKT